MREIVFITKTTTPDCVSYTCRISQNNVTAETTERLCEAIARDATAMNLQLTAVEVVVKPAPVAIKTPNNAGRNGEYDAD